jgi:choline dehydrogenase-like flavoprotein
LGKNFDFLFNSTGIKLALKIIEETPSFKNLNARYIPKFVEPCQHQHRYPYRSDEYWNCFIQYEGKDARHPVGTARMGRKNDEMAVVDGKLRYILFLFQHPSIFAKAYF